MFEKILLAVDLNDTEGAKRAAAKGGALAGLSGAELHVMNVVPEMGFNLVGAAFGPEHMTSVLDESRKALSAWAAETLPQGAADHVHVAQGSIYDQIIRTADRIGADAIVVGAHRPEFRDYLVGPNAARVVRHAKQAVLVVR